MLEIHKCNDFYVNMIFFIREFKGTKASPHVTQFLPISNFIANNIFIFLPVNFRIHRITSRLFISLNFQRFVSKKSIFARTGGAKLRRAAGTTRIFRDGAAKVESSLKQSGPGDRWETIKHDAVNNRRRRRYNDQENSASVPVHRQE